MNEIMQHVLFHVLLFYSAPCSLHSIIRLWVVLIICSPCCVIFHYVNILEYFFNPLLLLECTNSAAKQYTCKEHTNESCYFHHSKAMPRRQGGLGRKISSSEIIVGKGKSRRRCLLGEDKTIKRKVRHNCEMLPNVLSSAIHCSKYLRSYNMPNAMQYFIWF